MAVSRFRTSSIRQGTPKYRNLDGGALPLPATPTIGTATDGGTGTTALVAFTPVGSYGQQYTAVSSPGSFTGTSVVSPITVSGLSAGTAYSFQVRSENATGVSGWSASSNSVTPVAPGAFESIATVTAAGGETSLSFTSIPQTYVALQIRGIARDTYGRNYSQPLPMRFNSDSSYNMIHELKGDGSSAYASAYGPGASYLWAGSYLEGTALASTYGASIIDIHDYSSTTRYKTVRAFSGADNNQASTQYSVRLHSDLWASTAAVTSITFYASPSFAAGTTFALYGIKGAA